MTHNGTCNNIKGQKHRVIWNFNKPEIEDEYLRISGQCLGCNTEFQSTFELIGNSIISKKSGRVENFNYPILEPQFENLPIPITRKCN